MASASTWLGRLEDVAVVDSGTGRLHLANTFERFVHDSLDSELGEGIRIVFPEAEKFAIEIE